MGDRSVKMAFREKGQGKLLVCLHGYGGSVLHWEKVAEDLSRSFRVVTPNLTHLYIGTERLRFSQQIEIIVQFIHQQFPGEKIFLSGISYGGALAWGVALQYPDLVEKVVFINPMPPSAQKYFAIPMLRVFFSLPMPRALIYWFLQSPMGKSFLKESARVFRNLQANEDDDRIDKLKGRKLQFVAGMLGQFSWLLHSEDWRKWQKRLQHWNQDCLLIYDRRDPLFQSSFYDQFAQTLSGTNVVTTLDAGHISIVQQPKLIAGAVKEYLLRDFFKSAEGYN